MIYSLDIAALPAGYGEALLPLALAKAHLHVIENDEDELIAAMRDAAVMMVEQYTEVVLAPRTQSAALVWRGEALPHGNAALRVGLRPITGVVSVTWLDGAGTEQSIDVDTLRILDGDSIAPLPGVRWPSGVAGGVTVRVDAGLAGGTAPPALLAAARMFLATLYMQRETIVTAGAVGEVTHGFAMLCRPFRRLRV